MIENEPVLVDSNVLVYAYDIIDGEKHRKSEEIMSLAWLKKQYISLSTQNLSEFVSVITTKIQNPIDITIAYHIIEDITNFSHFKIFNISPKEILAAMRLIEEFKIEYWDALIVSVMQEHNIKKIITENEKDFKKIPWLTVINPFKK